MKIIKNTNKGFTLVELIIVITILAILGTIGFVSFQGYTSDARDTKRTTDLSSLTSALEAKRAGNSLSLVSFVDSSTAGHVTWDIEIAWNTLNWTWTKYSAWLMNFSLLWIAAADFQDPNGFAYSFWATSLKWGQYQFAAVLEKWETPTALVKWNYSPRTMEDIDVTPSIRNAKKVEISDTTNFAKLIVWDKLAEQTAVAGTCKVSADTIIKSVSSDLKYITVDKDITLFNGDTKCSISLKSSEVAGLIWDYSNATASGTTSPVTDGSITALPY